MKNVAARLFGHTHAVVAHAHNHVVARDLARHLDSQLPLARHGVAYSVLHERLQQKRRHQHVFHTRIDPHLHLHAVGTETRHFEREVPLRLLHLTREHDQIGGVFKRSAIEHGEFAQQLARRFGVGANE